MVYGYELRYTHTIFIDLYPLSAINPANHFQLSHATIDPANRFQRSDSAIVLANRFQRSNQQSFQQSHSASSFKHQDPQLTQV